MISLLKKVLNRFRQLSNLYNPLMIRASVYSIPFWVRNKIAMRKYTNVTELELKKNRKSDTVFIFGSGYSLHDITSEEWKEIEQHDTIGFNWFVHQDFVRVDYHLIREIAMSDSDPEIWKPALTEYGNLIRTSPHYTNTIMLVQGEFRALNGNRLVSMNLLPRSNRIFRFKTKSRSVYEQPTKSIGEGLVHGNGTLLSAVNLAYSLGWKNIVLVGVDLYDRRYFWLEREETRINDVIRQQDHKQTHNTANKLIPYLGKWCKLFEQEGVCISVYNPKSLLTEIMPVFNKKKMEGTAGQ